tara:strand:+ start:10677 stop:10985 length:309 start_codon:yes stop_codon:yes gene_type:complete
MKRTLETIYHEDENGSLVQLKVYLEEYRKGGTSITLADIETGEPYATATVWVPGLEEDEVAIKNYSENQGILDNLILHGIVYKPHRSVQNGFVDIPICKLKV